MSIPYAAAKSGFATRDEITKMLRRFGCESVGFMDDFEEYSVLLAFRHRGRQVELRASAKGWAQMFLKENPWTSRRTTSRVEYEQQALRQGVVAVNSILRDWVKGQITAIECGILSFEAIFMPHMLTNDGTPLFQRIEKLGVLAPPANGQIEDHSANNHSPHLNA